MEEDAVFTKRFVESVKKPHEERSDQVRQRGPRGRRDGCSVFAGLAVSLRGSDGAVVCGSGNGLDKGLP